MNEVLCHLLGDYLLQTDKMAKKKTQSWLWAIIHATTYTLPFLTLTRDPRRLAVILGTHATIDRYRLATYVVALKNASTDWANRDKFFKDAKGNRSMTGFDPETPAWMAVWLLIITDNTLHLSINRLALSYGNTQEKKIP